MRTSSLHSEKSKMVYATFYFNVVGFCECTCLCVCNISIRKSTTLKLPKLEHISCERQFECTLPCKMCLPPLPVMSWDSNGTLRWHWSVFQSMTRQSLEKKIWSSFSIAILSTDHSLARTVKTDVLSWGISATIVWTYIEILIFTTLLMFLVLFIWHLVLFLLLLSWYLDLLENTSSLFYPYTQYQSKHLLQVILKWYGLCTPK